MKKIRNTIFIILFLSIVLSACAYFHDGKISQDKLPWNQSGTTLLTENFSNAKSNWEEVNNVYELKLYSPQGYFVSVNPPDGRTVSTSGKVFSDAKFSVDIQKITGPNDTSFGLICRYLDKQNYYAFSISSDGYAGIIKVENGKSSMISGDQYIHSDLIKSEDSVNSLIAACVGDTLSLNVNGTDLITVKDESFTIGELGLFLETSSDGGASALFNKYLVVKP